MSSKSKAPETVVFNLRITRSMHEWLQQQAAHHGVEINQLVRWAIEALKQYIGEQGGALHLPIDLQAYWQRAQSDPAIIFPALRAAESGPDDAPLPENAVISQPQTGSYIPPPKKRGTAK